MTRASSLARDDTGLPFVLTSLFPSVSCPWNLSMERDRQQRQKKRALRRSIRDSILGLDPGVRAAEEASLIARFPALPGYAAAQTVLLYVSAFAEEINTQSFFLHALEAGKRVLCPRVLQPENRMRLFQITSPRANLEPGILGIPEPGARLRPRRSRGSRLGIGPWPRV